MQDDTPSAFSFAPGVPATDSVAAATVVIMRAGPAKDADPELLMVRRSPTMAFAPDALVFPGGRVDPEDRALAADYAPDLDPDDAAARFCAIRETVEEAGLALGLPGVDGDALAALRSDLLSGGSFAAWLQREGVAPELHTLTPFARWCPNLRESRIFDTRFYAAAARDGDVDAALTVPEGELTQIFWSSARDTLARADAGDVAIIFPTRRNLERLAAFGSLEALRDSVAGRPVPLTMPEITLKEGERFLCIPDDHGYPVTSELLTSVRRG